MAKRFIDTGIFNDSWFIDLTSEQKLLYIYLFTTCDHAGIIDFNKTLATVQTGIKDLPNSFQTLSEGFGNRLIRLREGENYFFLPKFIKNQYPNGLNPSVKATASVIRRLSDFNLLDSDFNLKLTLNKEFGNPYKRVQDIDIDIDKDIDKNNGGLGEFLNFLNTEIYKSVVTYFSLSEIRNPNDLIDLNRFLNIRKSKGNLPEFERQFPAYCEYKKITKQATHSFRSFIGDLSEDNGNWCLRNWVDELTKIDRESFASGSTVRKLTVNEIFES
jgi:hypothetical protein